MGACSGSVQPCRLMRVFLRSVVFALGAASLTLGCAAGGLGIDDGPLGSPVMDSGSMSPAPDGAPQREASAPEDSGSKTPAKDAGTVVPPGDSSTPSEAATPPSDTGSPMPDVAAPPPPPVDSGSPAPDSGSGSDDCDTSKPKYFLEYTAEISSGDESLCVLGCTATQCCYELLCVAK
jgi:hypothetical protein